MRTRRPIRLRITSSLGLVYLPAVAVLRSSLLGAGSWFRLTPPRAFARGDDPCPSGTTQQQIPGLLPGTGAHRSTIDDFVRSSVLVFKEPRVAARLRVGGVRATKGPNGFPDPLFPFYPRFAFHWRVAGRFRTTPPGTPQCAHPWDGTRTPQAVRGKRVEKERKCLAPRRLRHGMGRDTWWGRMTPTRGSHFSRRYPQPSPCASRDDAHEPFIPGAPGVHGAFTGSSRTAGGRRAARR